jgi:hypothetical protein
MAARMRFICCLLGIALPATVFFPGGDVSSIKASNVTAPGEGIDLDDALSLAPMASCIWRKARIKSDFLDYLFRIADQLIDMATHGEGFCRV